MFKRKSGRPLDWMIMLKLYSKHTMTSGPSGVILKELNSAHGENSHSASTTASQKFYSSASG